MLSGYSFENTSKDILILRGCSFDSSCDFQSDPFRIQDRGGDYSFSLNHTFTPKGEDPEEFGGISFAFKFTDTLGEFNINLYYLDAVPSYFTIQPESIAFGRQYVGLEPPVAANFTPNEWHYLDITWSFGSELTVYVRHNKSTYYEFYPGVVSEPGYSGISLARNIFAGPADVFIDDLIMWRYGDTIPDVEIVCKRIELASTTGTWSGTSVDGYSDISGNIVPDIGTWIESQPTGVSFGFTDIDWNTDLRIATQFHVASAACGFMIPLIVSFGSDTDVYPVRGQEFGFSSAVDENYVPGVTAISLFMGD